MNIDWDADGYKRDFGFVPGYGAAVADLIDAPAGARVLDLGCGNGALTAELRSRGYDAFGLDASPEMLELARSTHPDLRFIQGNATDFALDEPVDAVFSNAVLHWIDAEDQSRALGCVARALKPGGQFVFEMGGHGCAGAIHAALARAFERRGLTYELAFFFPTVGEYAPLVEAAGMRVAYATLFERPTPLKGADGLADWIRMFDKKPFEGMAPAIASEIIVEAVAELEPTLRREDGTWIADYVRLRMRAVKL